MSSDEESELKSREVDVSSGNDDDDDEVISSRKKSIKKRARMLVDSDDDDDGDVSKNDATTNDVTSDVDDDDGSDKSDADDGSQGSSKQKKIGKINRCPFAFILNPFGQLLFCPTNYFASFTLKLNKSIKM